MRIQVLVCQMVIIIVSARLLKLSSRTQVDDGQADDAHVKEAPSQEAHAKQAGPIPISNVTQTSNSSGLDEVNQPCSFNVHLNFYHKSSFRKPEICSRI